MGVLVSLQPIGPGGEALAQPALEGRGAVPGQVKNEEASGAKGAGQGRKALGEVRRLSAQAHPLGLQPQSFRQGTLALRQDLGPLFCIGPEGFEQGVLRQRGGVEQEQTMAALGRPPKALLEGPWPGDKSGHGYPRAAGFRRRDRQSHRPYRHRAPLDRG